MVDPGLLADCAEVARQRLRSHYLVHSFARLIASRLEFRLVVDKLCGDLEVFQFLVVSCRKGEWLGSIGA